MPRRHYVTLITIIAIYAHVTRRRITRVGHYHWRHLRFAHANTARPRRSRMVYRHHHAINAHTHAPRHTHTRTKTAPFTTRNMRLREECHSRHFAMPHHHCPVRARHSPTDGVFAAITAPRLSICHY